MERSNVQLDVVYAEDDPALRLLYSRWMREAGFAVREAADGLEALERIRERCPQVLLTDIGMPRLDGIELARQVLDVEEWDPAVVFLSARTPTDPSLELLSDEYLLIPFPPEQIAERLRAVVSRRALPHD